VGLPWIMHVEADLLDGVGSADTIELRRINKSSNLAAVDDLQECAV
jgi:hypothetical protein